MKHDYVNPSFRLLKRAIVPTALLALATLGTTIAYSENSVDESADKQWSAHQEKNCDSPLEGSWLYTATLAGPYEFLGTETYAAGGGYSEADQLEFTPGYLATAGHGGWKQIGKDTYLLTYMNLTYQDGTAMGSSKVRQIMHLTHDGKEYVGSGDYTYYKPDGVTVTDAGTFTITAKKIALERPGS